MNYSDLIPAWAQPIFREAGIELNFEERKMNCSACTLYSASVKCCTFFPNLSNFAAGIELSKNPSIFDALLAQPELSLPLGIVAPDSYKQRYASNEFGTNEELLCPHFDRKKQNCGIWSSRPSSCVRFVCKSSLGNVGQEIWGQTESALGALEMNLAYEAALQLGLVNYEIATDRWKVSAEEKRKFYVAAADFVESLSASQKIDLAGEEFSKARSTMRSLARDVALRAAL